MRTSLSAWSLLTLINGRPNGSLQRLGRHAGSHDEVDAVGRALLVRDVHAGADLIAEPGDLLTRNDADDFPGDLLAELGLARHDFSHEDAATDRVLIGKLPLGQRLVDERDGRCARHVVVAQHASCKQLDAQCVEVRRADDLEERRPAIGPIRQLATGDRVGDAVAPALQR